jgi:hypothetical protein
MMLKHLFHLLALCATSVVALDYQQYPNVQHEGTPTGEVKAINNGTIIFPRRSSSLLTTGS